MFITLQSFSDSGAALLPPERSPERKTLWRTLSAAIIKYCSLHRHTKWKVEVILTFGTSELFELLARRNGPMESGCDYAMEKDEWKQKGTKGKKRT